MKTNKITLNRDSSGNLVENNELQLPINASNTGHSPSEPKLLFKAYCKNAQPPENTTKFPSITKRSHSDYKTSSVSLAEQDYLIIEECMETEQEMIRHYEEIIADSSTSDSVKKIMSTHLALLVSNLNILSKLRKTSSSDKIAS